MSNTYYYPLPAARSSIYFISKRELPVLAVIMNTVNYNFANYVLV